MATTPRIDDLLKELELRLPVPGAKVLVVDDEAHLRELLIAVLERAGLPVLTAGDVASAIRTFEAERPLVVLTDKNLPDGSGLDVVRRCKASAPDSEFILMTGYASMETAIEAVELGAFGYIAKPFEIDVLTERVQAALEKSRGAIRSRFLLERLRAAYGELYKLKVELELFADVLQEKQRQRDGEVGPFLADLPGVLGAAAAELQGSNLAEELRRLVARAEALARYRT